MPRIFSPDFSRELLFTNMPVDPLDQNGGNDYYVVDVGTGVGKQVAAQGVTATQAFGATSDLGRVVFKGTAFDIYAIEDGSLELLSIDPNGTTWNAGLQPGVAGGAFKRGFGVGEGREPAPWVERGGDHAVSDDARRVYMTTLQAANAYLYVRDLEAVPVPRTIAVSASSRTGDPPGTLASAQFISASHDGSAAYFASTAQLTDAATPGGGIYRFDLASESVTQITPDAGDPTGLNLAGAIASDDQSHIYFTSTSALAGAAQPGDTNAYVWTSADGVRFIAKAGAGDRFSRVTPDGSYALMLTSTSVDGAPNNGFRAVYRYDDQTQQLVCVSCRPDGSPSNGGADIDGQSGGFPQGPNPHNRALTLDGRVVFTSSDRLLTTDQTSAQDVYIYENGTVSLLTAGKGDFSSYIGDVSDDGANIFIITRSALVGADRDIDEYDVYDVRVDGGFLEPSPSGDPCSGDDCQGPPLAAPKLLPSWVARTEIGDLPRPATAKALRVAELSASRRKRLARTGRTVVRVRVAGGGRLAIGGRGLKATRRQVRSKTGTTVAVVVRLSSAARRKLAQSGRVSVTLTVRLSGLSRVVRKTIDLRRP